MEKRRPILCVEPEEELRFRGPFDDVVKADLILTNTSEKSICFRVKTTAPKRYCVRPNQGIIKTESTTTVAVMLQPFDYDENEKNRHKFMVQYAFSADDDVSELDSMWKTIPLDQLMNIKLQVVFEIPISKENRQENPEYDAVTGRQDYVEDRAHLVPEWSHFSEGSKSCNREETAPAFDSRDFGMTIEATSDEIILYDCGLCLVEGKTEEAKKFCENCKSNLCDFCLYSHKRFDELRKHRISDIMVATSRKTKPLTWHVTKCSCNKENPIDSFCETHHEVSCIVCMSVKHRTCNTFSVQQKSKLLNLERVDVVAQNAKCLHDNIKKVESDTLADQKTYMSSKDQCKKEVGRFRSEIQAWLDKLENNLLNEIDNGDHGQNLHKDLLTLSSISKSIDEDVKKLEIAKSYGDKETMFILEVKISRNLEDYTSVLSDIKSQGKSPYLMFKRNSNIESLAEVEKSLGTISI